MRRLIDADALIHKLKTAIELGQRVDGSVGELKAVLNDLESMPTIDAEPVRHGKWIGYAGTIGNECSLCGKWIDVLQGTVEMNYCPNCGARMNGE